MRIETIHPKELNAEDAALWRAHQLGDASLQSPYLTPDWARIVGAVRGDARICVLQDGAGFFGAQRLSRFAAMGLGAPIADYQGLVGLPGLSVSGADLCRALGVGRIDLTHVPSGQSILTGRAAGREGSWTAQTSGGRALYEAALRTRRAEFVRQTDKKLRKFEREHGPIEIRAASTDRSDFDALIGWKNAQLAASGQPRIWAKPWVRETLEACFEARDASFSGLLFTMRAGGKLAAAAFALRSGRTAHLWLIAHDETFNAYSPGVQLARALVGWAGERGVAEVDFGPGAYQYKRQLSTGQRTLERGAASRLSWSATVRRAEHAMRAQLERLPPSSVAALPGKAMRRLDLMRALAG